MGGGEALPEFTCKNLVSALASRNDCTVILAWDEDLAVGLCNCFECFSTFACKPILNIHDVYVAEGYRGRGIASQMMQKAEQLAHARGCCKLTLEVLTHNKAAKASYTASGYAPYQLDSEFGQAEFWQKSI
jgi:GNAT superfamily N-acetyltransferase